MQRLAATGRSWWWSGCWLLPCKEADPGVPGSTCIRVQARLADDEVVSFDTTDPTETTFRAGQEVRLSVLEQEGQPAFFNIRGLERARPMLMLVALFMLAVLAFGRWQGIRSLIALAVSFAVIVEFVIPAILHGRSPVPVAWWGRWPSCWSRCTSAMESAARRPRRSSAPASPWS
jgi:hypothetical protein